MYKDELDHFMNCIKNKKNTINSLDDAIDTLKIALAIRDGTKLKKINY
jgi:predicted dehydrogenase